MAGKWDKEIKALFALNFGAREIAKRLGLKYHSTVSKRLIKLNLKRGFNIVETDKLKINIQIDKSKLSKSSIYYAQMFCALHNFEWALPPEEASYDLLIDFGNGFKKIQIKSSTYLCKSGNYQFALKRSRSNSKQTTKKFYNSSECDYFMLIDAEFNMWIIPFEKLVGVTSVTPKSRYPGFLIQHMI